MHPLHPVSTTPLDKLRTEIEQRTTYTLNRCEFNIFETHRKVENVRLTFGGFTITSMLRGKKVLRGDTPLNYLPGESYLVSSSAEMVIDFPEANHYNPTQCTALVIENAYLQKQLEYINENFPKDAELHEDWNLKLDQPWLQNSESLATMGNRLIRIFSGNDPLKDVLIDLKLKELILSIMRLQNYHRLGQVSSSGDKVNERFRAVIDYIRRNITSEISIRELSNLACMSKSVFYRTFTHEFGVPPTQLILSEKIRYAKSLLAGSNVKIKEVCFASGFSDPNYFSRVFRKHEGITPMQYVAKVNASA